ncbi:P-loop containing nucleoside triphosphate hydrolase protein [Calycina marina]|uniref:RNA helicase n=1 Tax=Calycina marina TaxID=1763456 RepID=A0A9P7Z2N0_9HELO|nr:P-loop containing nucleoside triphosphate hydrolase protein [Calycina marina]
MSLRPRRMQNCLRCIFQVSEWLAPSIAARGSHTSPRRYFSAAQPFGREYTVRRIRLGSDEVEVNPFRSAAAGRPKAQRQKYERFEELVAEAYRKLFDDLHFTDARGQISCLAWGIKSSDALKDKKKGFVKVLRKAMGLAYDHKDISRNPIFYKLRRSFVLGNVAGLSQCLRYLFVESALQGSFLSDNAIQSSPRQLADLSHPNEWYPATRAIQRTVHLHIGPTNSGKTYHALKKLEAAETGVYAGPLRLLAHEVYTRFNAAGKQCALITGEERRVPEGMTKVMSSCTVEMVPLNVKVDVAVIDEVQMMGDRTRGWAWTQAFLGVQAKEVHLCGEVRTEDLVRKLCASIGDKLVVHRYKRLSPLEVQKSSINGDLTKLEKGDAIILFSRVAIHAMKKKIEARTGKLCAVVYGSLPPETRAQQAALFNDPNNDYDFLAASDAIGMGLNLSVRRIIFESTAKHDGVSFRVIETSEVKQIGGRAGRYKSAHDAITAANSPGAGRATGLATKPQATSSTGYVTTLQNVDLPVVKKGMETNAPSIATAGVIPPDVVIKRFASYFPPGTPFSYILLRLYDVSLIDPKFFLCPIKDQLIVADIIQPFKLTVGDRLKFIAAPTSVRDPKFIEVLAEFAKCVADQSNGHLLDMKSIPIDMLDMNPQLHMNGAIGYLKDAEFLHRAITTYIWLSYRFNGVFISQALAFHVKELIEVKINDALDSVKWSKGRDKLRMAMQSKTVTQQLKEKELAKNDLQLLPWDDEKNIPISAEIQDVE